MYYRIYMQIMNSKSLLAQIEIPIVILDGDSRICHFTSQAGRLLKLTSADTGCFANDIIIEINVLNLYEITVEVMDTMTTKVVETQVRTGLWYRLLISPYRTTKNKIKGVIVTFIDIDVYKRNELALMMSKEDAVSILDSMPLPLLVICLDKKIKMANKAFYEKFKVEKIETVGRFVYELGNGQWNIPNLLNILDQTLKENKEFNAFEMEHQFPIIGHKNMLLSAKKAYLSGSKVSMALLSIEDVTDLRLINRKFKGSEEKYHNLLVNSYDGILVLRHDDTIEFVNPQLEKMFGYEAGELLNKKYDILIPVQKSEKHQFYHSQYMLNPSMKKMAPGADIYAQKKDGTLFPVDVSFSPFNSNSEVLINCTVRDISVRIKLEEARKDLQLKEKALLEEAEKANRIKDEFLATLSHELRTPLTAILGWAQELRNESIDKKTLEEGLIVIERSAQAQEQLINDLLDISRIQSDKVSLNIQEIDLVKILELVMFSINKIAEKKSIRIENKIKPIICWISADAIRLQQVFWNLLINAIKFTPEGGQITVALDLIDAVHSVELTNESLTEPLKVQHVQIQITDTGIGIKSEFLSKIFNRFSQVDSTTVRTHGGLGLGLAIARSLIEMQKGTIVVKSEGENKGATFIVTLPAIKKDVKKNEEIAPMSEAPLKAKSLSGLKILAVDDNVDNRILFSVILKSLHADVRLADSVAEALKILPEFKPDILLSDISMPDQDGYSLLSKIRESEIKTEKKLPVVALTAHAGPEDAQQMLQAGFDAHVPKPVNKILLANVILKLLGRLN